MKKKISMFSILAIIELICGLILITLSNTPCLSGSVCIGQGLAFLVIIIAKGWFYD